MKTKLNQAVFYGIVDLGYVSAENVETATRELINGGAGVIQLRAKGLELAEVENLAGRIQPICAELAVPFIVNDFAEIALRVGADGVHIGQDDGNLASVREIVGDEMLVGRSTHSPEQAEAAQLEGFDYIGFGPLFPTPTKQGRPGIGIENVQAVQAAVGADIPVFCIGGVTRSSLDKVIESGARRVVVVSDVLRDESISAAAREVVERLENC